MRVAWVYRLEAHCIVRADPFLDPRDALEAAGLSA
jgi:hypothetical protein